MEKLDDLRMELVQIREAIDMAETVLDMKEDEGIRKQLVELRRQEADLNARIIAWGV